MTRPNSMSAFLPSIVCSYPMTSFYTNVHDEWFSERKLVDEGLIQDALTKLEANGTVYKKDGAKWFKATDYGDEKDRVVVRDNGVTTYFASDIAYHLSKRQRGNDINNQQLKNDIDASIDVALMTQHPMPRTGPSHC